ncbi:hypothetical protein D3C87_1483100 [compost metagenome]
MRFFRDRQIPQQLACRRILGARCRLDIETMRSLLHCLGFRTRLFDRHFSDQPVGLASGKVANMLAADKRDAVAETLDMHVDQPLAMMALFLSHLLEHFCRVRIFFSERIGIGEIDAAIILLGGNRQRQDFLFVEGEKRTLGAGEEAGKHRRKTFFRIILK